MTLLTTLEKIIQRHRYTTPDDIRKTFGDYHNALHWLALFLVGDEELAQECVIDVCTIATGDTPKFHEWLIDWAVRATFRAAFQYRRMAVEELAPVYEKEQPVHEEHPPLLAEQFRQLIRHSKHVHSHLDVLCRFVLVMRGIAKDSVNEVAAQLRISPSAAERAYCIGFDIVAQLPQLTSYGTDAAVKLITCLD